MPGRRDDERHAQRRVVDQHAVRALAVIAKPLAMIAGDGDDRAIRHPPGAQRVEQARELRIGIRDLAVVGRARARAELGRRGVRRVGIVEVHPHEECGLRIADCGLTTCGLTTCGLTTCGLAIEPGERMIDHDRGGAFGFEAVGRVGVARDLVVVDVEPLPQPESVIEHERANEGGGVVARALQQPRQRLMRAGERVDPVLAHAVHRRQQPGMNRRMRRQCQRHRGARRDEAEARRGQAIDRRRNARADAIRAEGVDGDEQDVPRLRLRRRRGRAGQHQGEWQLADGYSRWSHQERL